MYYSCLESHFGDGIKLTKRDFILLAETLLLVITALRQTKKGHRGLKVQQTFTAVVECQRQKREVIAILAPSAGVFRGARFSFLPINAWSTENNIPFPLFYLHGKGPIESFEIKC